MARNFKELQERMDPINRAANIQLVHDEVQRISPEGRRPSQEFTEADMLDSPLAATYRRLSRRLEEIKVAESMRTRDLAPLFSPFEAFLPNETALSRVLAYLLDDKAGHGQGDKFLQQFLGLIDYPVREFRSVRVSTEFFTPTGRRIDIVLRFDGHAIGIENKPWATEQDEHCSDYAKELHRLAPDRWTLVFLTSDGRPPKSGKGPSIKGIRYVELADGFEKSCGNERLKPFLSAFTRYVRERINGEPSRELGDAKMIDELLKPENIGVTVEVLLRAKEIRQALIERFKTAMLMRLKSDFGSEWQAAVMVAKKEGDVKDAYDFDQIYSGLYFFKPGWKDRFCIGFSNQRDLGRNVIFGVHYWNRKRSTKIANGKFYEELNKVLPRGKSSDWWDWYLTLSDLDKPEYQNWYDGEVLRGMAAIEPANSKGIIMDDLYPLVRMTVKKAELIDEEIRYLQIA